MVRLLVESLTHALAEQGLTAEQRGTDAVWAANRSAGPPDGHAAGAAMSPGLSQTVVCRPDGDGTLLWWWVWSGPERDAPPEHEPLGPAVEIEATAARIVSVLRLDGIDAEAIR